MEQMRGLPEGQVRGMIGYWEGVRDDAQKQLEYADLQLDQLHNMLPRAARLAIVHSMEAPVEQITQDPLF